MDTLSQNLLFILQIIGTIAFAISGALVAGKKNMDIFGVVILGIMVAVGGGSIRDILLGITPVFWVQNSWYILLAATSALLSIPLSKHIINNNKAYLLSDAIGLAVFSILGTQKALEHESGYLVAITMGLITGVFGGVLRDVLANRAPSVLYSEIYAMASIVGSILFIAMLELHVELVHAIWLSIVFITLLRIFAIIFKWSLPVFRLDK